MELKTNLVSLPYNNIDFTHELHIPSFVRLEICKLAHTACILPKAARALFSLQLILRTAVCSDHAKSGKAPDLFYAVPIGS